MPKAKGRTKGSAQTKWVASTAGLRRRLTSGGFAVTPGDHVLVRQSLLLIPCDGIAQGLSWFCLSDKLDHLRHEAVVAKVSY